jgi:hypothetical protein
LPAVEINTIRRLSNRVNVLPVVARGDILSNDRLAAIKLAIRRDLAEAGIGFGIFDMDTYQQPQDDISLVKNGESSNGYGGHANGSSSSANNTPPTSPVTPAFLRLPYALISPDVYSHSDGVARITPPRHELVQQYTPSPHYLLVSKVLRGRFTRSYRWGQLDVLDPNHSDFLTLRAAIFHHMEVGLLTLLQLPKYSSFEFRLSKNIRGTICLISFGMSTFIFSNARLLVIPYHTM